MMSVTLKEIHSAAIEIQRSRILLRTKRPDGLDYSLFDQIRRLESFQVDARRLLILLDKRLEQLKYATTYHDPKAGAR